MSDIERTEREEVAAAFLPVVEAMADMADPDRARHSERHRAEDRGVVPGHPGRGGDVGAHHTRGGTA